MINNVSLQSNGTLISFTEAKNGVTALNEGLPATILPANPNRMYASFVVKSKSPVTFFFGNRNNGDYDKGIPLNPEGTFEINLMNLYRGEVSAICENEAKISWVECE